MTLAALVTAGCSSGTPGSASATQPTVGALTATTASTLSPAEARAAVTAPPAKPKTPSNAARAAKAAKASADARPAAKVTASKAGTAHAAKTVSHPLAGKVIVIDPGHNGGNYTHLAEINRQVDAGFGLRKACNTTGTETNAHYTEAAYTFSVATRLATLLRAEGAKVVMTRTSNAGWGPCINERAAIGNRAKADAVLSIHGDGNLARGARGFHIIVAQRMVGGSRVQQASQHLADVVRAAYRSGAGMPYSTYTGGGVAETHRTDIGGLNLSTRPAVMIETGNMRSATDAALMSSATWRERAAKALAAGLERYLS